MQSNRSLSELLLSELIFFLLAWFFLSPEKAKDKHAIVVKIPWKLHAAAGCLSDRQLKWPRNDISPLANIIKVYYLSGRSTVNKCPSKVRLKDREGADNEIQGWQMALSLTLWHLTERDIQRVWNFCLCSVLFHSSFSIKKPRAEHL